MPDTTPQPNLDARLLGVADMRIRFREATAHPLRETLQRRSGLQAAAAIAQIPLEAASSGFDVHICQHSDGWKITVSRRIDSETEFYCDAKAMSLRAAMVQIVEAGLAHLDQLDTETRRAIRIAEATLQDATAA